MYNDRLKPVSPRTLSADCDSPKCESPSPRHHTGGPVRELGDVEQQMLRLNGNINEMEKMYSELMEKLYPILIENCNKESCGDCAVEKSVSPLANDLRIQNSKLDGLKTRIMETILRIQL